MELSARSPPELLLLLLLLLLSSISPSSAEEIFTVSSHPAKFVLPPGIPVAGSPGSKSESLMYCNRVHILGFPRLRNLDKYANSLRIRANFSSVELGLRIPFFDVCFHRNGSVGVGMCPAGSWEKVVKGSWAQSMSPYDTKILDIRLPKGLSSKLIEVSTEEEFMLHRVVFLAVGLLLMVLAHGLSQSVVFYYGSAMTAGILLVVLIVLFQGMKLLPTGRKSSFAIFMYSSIIGVGTFLSRYVSGLLRSLLVEIGISEDMHNPLMMLLICCLVLVGAWLGFWSVRKLVLVDGFVDESIAYFVDWAILIFAAAMIVESSLDPLLSVAALIFGILLSVISRRTRKLKLLRHLCRRVAKCLHGSSQYSPSVYTDSDYRYRTPTRTEPKSLKPRARAFASSPDTTNAKSSVWTSSQRPSVDEMHYSSFHRTPDRKKYSKEEWKEFTRDSTRRAMEELCASPDFGRWAAANADRISVTPRTGSSSSSDDSDKVQRRFYWF